MTDQPSPIVPPRVASDEAADHLTSEGHSEACSEACQTLSESKTAKTPSKKASKMASKMEGEDSDASLEPSDSDEELGSSAEEMELLLLVTEESSEESTEEQNAAAAIDSELVLLVTEETLEPSQQVAIPQVPVVPAQASLVLKDVLAAVEEQTDPEAKLAVAIAFMERAMSRKGSPDFRTFYALRKICQDLFRGSVAPGLRQKLWRRYSELQDEARRLKQIIDEESDFAAEQIEIAVKGLEEELENFPQLLEKAPDLPLTATVKALQESFDSYITMQKELQLLNACAARIHSLRKELTRISMRIGQKNRFFHRLSVAGDRVFPRRKELMTLISDRFLSDVEKFSKDLLARPNLSEMVYFLREEVKAFQYYAKFFTLTPKTFNKVRTELGTCWETLREAEKEHRKERAKLRVVSQGNVRKVEEMLEEANAAFAAGTLTVDAGKAKVEELFSLMRTLEFDRDALRGLQDKLRGFREKLLNSLRSAEELRERQQKAQEQERRAALIALRGQIDRLVRNTSSTTADELSQEYQKLVTEIEQCTAVRAEKLDLQRRLHALRDAIASKKAKELLAMPSETSDAAQQLQALLESHIQQRNEIRTQLEEYRAQQARSGQTFAQALALQEQVEEERQRLSRLEEVIEEITTKLSEIAG